MGQIGGDCLPSFQIKLGRFLNLKRKQRTQKKRITAFVVTCEVCIWAHEASYVTNTDLKKLSELKNSIFKSTDRGFGKCKGKCC